MNKEENVTSEDLVRMMNQIDERNERIDKIRRKFKFQNDARELLNEQRE